MFGITLGAGHRNRLEIPEAVIYIYIVVFISSNSSIGKLLDFFQLNNVRKGRLTDHLEVKYNLCHLKQNLAVSRYCKSVCGSGWFAGRRGKHQLWESLRQGKL